MTTTVHLLYLPRRDDPFVGVYDTPEAATLTVGRAALAGEDVSEAAIVPTQVQGGQAADASPAAAPDVAALRAELGALVVLPLRTDARGWGVVDADGNEVLDVSSNGVPRDFDRRIAAALVAFVNAAGA